MTKRHALRRLRSAVQSYPTWAIHPPAMQELLAGLQAGATPKLNKFRSMFQSTDDSPARMQLVGGVAVIPVVGVLGDKDSWLTRYYGTSTQAVERLLRQAVADEKVKSIVLWFDTPGGTALGNQELYNAVLAARKKKPVGGFVRGQCCSAGFYIACATKPLMASPSSMIGSVGCIAVFMEYADLLKGEGIGVNIITHGANKSAGNSFQKLTPEHKATLQKMVDDYGGQFDQAVAAGRSVEVADVLKQYGQGQVFLANEAKQRGMIDSVGDWDALLVQITGSNPDSSVESHVQSESAPAAGDSAAKQSVPAAVNPPASTREKSSMDPRLKAALFARGLISSMEANDGECKAALNAYYAGRGIKSPESIDEQLVAVMSTSAPAAASATAPPAGANAGAASNVQTAHEREMAEARAEGSKNATARMQQITARGRLLGMSQEQIDAAVATNDTADQVAAKWVDARSTAEQPVNRGNVTVGQTGAERYAIDAAAAVQLRMGGALAERVPAAQRTGDVLRLSRAPLMAHAQACLKMAGTRFDEYAPPEEIMEQAFGMDGIARETLRSEGGPVNRPGSFPNLLSNLANKMLDDAIALAEGNAYQEWTGLWAGDLPDFKPAAVLNKSQLDSLDEILDAEAFKEFGLAEELSSYMQLGRFGNRFGLTPVMAANDDLQAFSEGLLGLGAAHEHTLNRLCLSQLTGNVSLVSDGYSLFDAANHGNDVDTGGAGPVDTEWEKMLLKVYAQTGIDGKGYVAAPLKVLLVPPKWSRTAQQTFANVVESKQAAVDSNINVYRGTATVVTEPQLQATSSFQWYGLCDPRFRATVVRAYFRGFGRNGRRQRYFDPATKVTYFDLEGRFGAAVKNFRYAVRNKGQA